VPEEDMNCLVNRDDDGTPVEPEWYAPVLPMLLVNGARGIGTGYSTFIPSYNPAQLKKMIQTHLETGTGLDEELVPYVRGFKGTIVKSGSHEYTVKGVWKIDKGTMTITELPVGTWTSDFRETLEKLLADGVIKDFSDTSTDTDVSITVKLGADSKVLEKHLTDKIKLTNMHAFNSKCVIHKYDSPNEILKEFVNVRKAMYSTRRSHLLSVMRAKLPYHENVVRFIRQQCLPVPVPELRKQTPEECDRRLDADKFARIKGGFDYLMNLPISALTLKHAQKHEQELEDLKKAIADMEAMTPVKMWKSELEKIALI